MGKYSGNFKKTIFIFSFIVFCFLNFPCLQAATVRINPTKIRLIIPPGESKSGVIEVENPSDESIVVKAYLQDWAYTNSHDGTKEFFPAGTTSLSGSSWISLSFSEFVIPAFTKQNINYTVKVPLKAQGGHYAVLFFESLLGKPKIRESASLGVVVRIGALFYIEPQGTVTRLAEISNLSLTKKSKDKTLNIRFDFKNTGNADITCKGTFHIMDSQGMIVARSEFNDAYTFPGDTAKLAADWKEPLKKGKYDLILTMDIGRALEEAGLGGGQVITKEAGLEIGSNGEVTSVGALK